ncbi:glycine betaine ABC transporter substrate-binding protein [Cellulosilyticum sp. ST5]|uniref:ABC-type glycine betaine transport, periplasmic subunit n=1 Tax=Cellulosilyticum lentocellum (strain ATCC 49066 / DSM 5427 / NCIMB 11756 / RHM5) TaxID=642492 RepID=F2JI01_CELLD|nr:glycine betaine ABC transporter substrate-binding protein [Cellulosilyticum lentocellum]ADZ81945.1 ABC-type glycine betaine transport, periplasmic subunit [Cellulosilyticum lentocellum DSM 5427]
MNFFEYISSSSSQIIELLVEHIKLTTLSVGFAILIGVPLGILICYIKKLNKPILGIANVIQAIPSMALLGFAIPFLGIGTLPAIVTVVLYSLLPIIKNTYTGINSIPPQTIESARGIGLTKLQILFKVQIPLALPVIMAGVRISAVTAVGLMTMAAFIGAGGLGYLVFSGIRTVNNNQILAGAIPACLLALLVDFLVATVEKLVTPISLQKVDAAKSRLSKLYYKVICVVVAAMLVILFLFSTIAAPKKGNKIITIGTKDFTEQMILGHMVADLIEDRTDITVERKINLGGTQVCFSALTSNAIDMYIEYSGTAYGDTLGNPPISDMKEVYATVKRDFKELYNIEVLKQMNFNNTYALAVTKEVANEYNLKKISDLSQYSGQLVSGTTLEFLNREDGMMGLTKRYNLKFKESIGLDGSPRYIALMNKEVDVVDAFSTDGLLKKFDLVVLEDDKDFFPPYYAIPIVRDETIERYPEIVDILDELGGYLNNETMINLNYQVDELQIEPEVVARQFLVDNNLID